MEAGALILSQKLGQHISNYIVVQCCDIPNNPWSYKILYHFEGRDITEFGNYSGYWCFYNRLYEDGFLYFGETADFETAYVPGPVTRLANLLQYKLYVAIDLEDEGMTCRHGTVCYMRMFHLPLLDDEDEWDYLR